jgi:hypothetical protein
MTDIQKWPLADDETLCWQGRPAPRCYTFRHWLQALIGTVLFLASSFWLMVGVQLVRDQGLSAWLLPVPALLVAGSFAVGPAQLIVARLRWEKIFYALTDRRLLVRNSLFGRRVKSFELRDYRRYRTRKYGKKQLSLRMSFAGGRSVVLECLEHPELLIGRLPEAGAGDSRSSLDITPDGSL